MQEQKTATLATIFSEVLANLAFMFTDEVAADVATGDLWLETTIAYKGPHKGTLRFRCSSNFSIQLAANLLGVDPKDDDAEEAAKDAAKEFMNIVCGQLVTAIHGTDDVFNLTIPEVRELSEVPDLAADDGSESATLCVDGNLIQLSLEA